MEEKTNRSPKTYTINLGQITLKDFNEKISPDKQWIQWGERNDFPEILLMMLYNSSTHYNIINKRKDMCLGDGVVIKKSTNKSKAETEQFLDNVNSYGETIDELLEKIFYDFLTFGQCAIQVIWGKGFNKIASLSHIPITNLRYAKKDENGNINHYYYSENWKKYRIKEFEPISIQAFTTNEEIIKVSPRQVMVIRPYSPGAGYYTQPTYVGGLNYISLDWQMSEFAQSTIKNGCFPSLIITSKNVPDEEKDYIVSQFESQYTKSANARKVLYNFVENLDDIKFDTLTTEGQEAMIETLNNLATNNILQAHGIPGILVGISEAGKLGESNEINNAYIEYEASVIKPDQNLIVEKINKLLKINNLDEIEITSSQPIPFQGSEDLMTKVLTVDEVRSTLGFEPLDKSRYNEIIDVVISNTVAANTITTPTTNQSTPVKPNTPVMDKSIKK